LYREKSIFGVVLNPRTDTNDRKRLGRLKGGVRLKKRLKISDLELAVSGGRLG